MHTDFDNKEKNKYNILISKPYCKKRYYLNKAEVYIIYCYFSQKICIRINSFLNTKVNTVHGSGIFTSLKRCSES